jgi:hypothetical protein
MSVPESADQEVLGNEDTFAIEGVDQSLTPLQYHYLSLLQRLIDLKNSYQTDPGYEAWLMTAIKKSIYSTLRDCIEANVGDSAKGFLGQEHQVN